MLDLGFEKNRFTCKIGAYCFGKAADIADPSLQQKAQGYRRTLSSSMRLLSVNDIYRMPKADGYFVTRKYDGEFALLLFDGKKLISLNPGGTVRSGLPAFVEAEKLLRKAGVKECILAGEVYLKEAPGNAQLIHQVESILRHPESKQELERLAVAVFDIVEADGETVRSAQDVFRLLDLWFKGGKRIHTAEYLVAKKLDEITEAFDRWVSKAGSEGLVVRSDQAGWFKIKLRHNLDVAVIGFSLGSEKRSALVHDLLFAVMRDDGTFHELGRVGGGFSEDDRRILADQFKRRIVASDYVAVNSDYVAYEMIHPGPVIEISYLDIVPERTKGGPINKMVLEWDGKRYSALERMPIASLISPQFIRLREDKVAHVEDVNIRQLDSVVQIADSTKKAHEIKARSSKMLRREVYTKTMKGKTMVRKLFMWKTNKEKDAPFPAYVVYLTDFSPNRESQLERDIKLAQTEAAAKKHFKRLAERKFVGGWQKAG